MVGFFCGGFCWYGVFCACEDVFFVVAVYVEVVSESSELSSHVVGGADVCLYFGDCEWGVSVVEEYCVYACLAF